MTTDKGSITTGNITGAGIAIGHGAVANVTINQIVQGLGDLPTHYDGPVRNFLEYYLGTPEHPAPFGGREADLAALDGWLDDANAPPYLLLAAPAGRGKSALLANWVAQLQERTNLGVVYFPVSIRFSTNRENIVFAALFARLAHISAEKATRATSAEEYRGVFNDYVRRTPPDGKRLLVVLDGLDEAAGWEAGADLFPIEPPPHLRVVVAARTLAGDPSWLARLGWESPGKAQTLSLAGLARDGVRDALAQMGNPLDTLATKIDVIAKLYELSEGDPLLVRLYVEALRSDGTEAATFMPEDLLTLKPGLRSYFDLWFKQQESLWQSADKPIDHDAVDDLLSLCATALGPLTKDDVHALAPERLKSSRTIERTVSAINRFVIGDGTEQNGYVFSHPRLRDYFTEQLTLHEQEHWESRFLEYGRNTIAALESGAVRSEDASAYIVTYYGAHLEKGNAPAHDFYALICEGWLRAWEWIHGTPDGFLTDANRAWTKAVFQGPSALGEQVRSALCFSSIVSLSANIHKDLLVSCLDAGIINSRLCLVMARSKPDMKERAECLAEISSRFQPGEQVRVLMEAVDLIRAIDDKAKRVDALDAFVHYLPTSPVELLQSAIGIALTLHHDSRCSSILRRLVVKLPAGASDVLIEAWAMVRSIVDGGIRAEALSVLAALLPDEDRRVILSEALQLVFNIKEQTSRADSLVIVAEELPPEVDELFTETLYIASTLWDERIRAEALCRIVKLIPPQKVDLLAKCLNMARQMRKEYARVLASATVAERLTGMLQEQALNEAVWLADGLSDTNARRVIKAYLVLARILPLEAPDPQLRPSYFAAGIRDRYTRARFLCELAQRFPKDERYELVAQALRILRNLNDEVLCAEGLSALVDSSPSENIDVQSQILEMVEHSLSNERLKARVLIELVKHLPQTKVDLLNEALRIAETFHLEASRFGALREIASRLSEETRHQVLKRALFTSRAIRDESVRAQTLCELALRLPSDGCRKVFGDALSLVSHLQDDYLRAETLYAVCQAIESAAISPADRVVLVDRLLESVSTVRNAYGRVSLLCSVARHAPRELILREALEVIDSIWDDEIRSNALLLVSTIPLASDGLENMLLSEALPRIRGIQSEYWRTEALTMLLARLPSGATTLLAEALDSAEEILNEVYRAQVLKTVIPKLSPGVSELFGRATSIVRAIRDAYWRIELLSLVAVQLPLEQREAIISENLSAAREVNESSWRAIALSVIAECCESEEQRVLSVESLYAIRTIDDERTRAEALREVVNRLPIDGDLIYKTLLIADSITTTFRITSTFCPFVA